MCNLYKYIYRGHRGRDRIFGFSLNIFYLLKCAKRIGHKINKLMKSSPIYNKLQHYLIVCVRGCSLVEKLK